MRKTVGRFRTARVDFEVFRIEQTHANGSDEVIATFIQLKLDTLLDLQYIVKRAIEDLENNG